MRSHHDFQAFPSLEKQRSLLWAARRGRKLLHATVVDHITFLWEEGLRVILLVARRGGTHPWLKNRLSESPNSDLWSLKNIHSDWQTVEDFQTMLYPKIND